MMVGLDDTPVRTLVIYMIYCCNTLAICSIYIAIVFRLKLSLDSITPAKQQCFAVGRLLSVAPIFMRIILQRGPCPLFCNDSNTIQIIHIHMYNILCFSARSVCHIPFS